MEKGDYIYDPNTGVSFILKNLKERYHSKVLCDSFCALVDGIIVFDYDAGLLAPPFNVNNPEIIEELDKALFKEGYYFDAAKLDMSEKRWMPEVGDTYYSPFYGEKIWYESAIDIGSWKMGFVCKTDHEADALIDVAREAIRKYLTNEK